MTKINEIVYGNCLLSIRKIAETVNTDKETVRKIRHNKLNMKKVRAELVPINLTTYQKLVSQQIYSDFLGRLHEEPELMENISDEMRIF